MPEQAPSLMAQLFKRFADIFPRLELKYDKEDYWVVDTSVASAAQYPVGEMSDGEKQAFSLLVEFQNLDREFSTIVVDEPELNLHPDLAERLWNLLEFLYQDRHFIYATHSINFAARPTVQSIYVLGYGTVTAIKPSGLRELPKTEMLSFLGSIPGVLWASKVLAIEGDENSFDLIFYQWLVGNEKIDVFPAGSCHDVEQAVKHAGIWDQISPDVKIKGVVDSDFDSQLPGTHGVIALNLHEAESYACIPELVIALAGRLGARNIDKESVINLIIGELERLKVQIVARRFLARSPFKVNPLIGKGVLNKLQSKADLKKAIRSKVEELKLAIDSLNPDKFDAAVDEEDLMISNVIKERDWEKALKLVPSKELVNTIAHSLDLKNAFAMIRAIKEQCSCDDFLVTKQLREDILKMFE
jgi:energy-coupling factor transporter ATP-binding protein EcfA2